MPSQIKLLRLFPSLEDLLRKEFPTRAASEFLSISRQIGNLNFAAQLQQSVAMGQRRRRSLQRHRQRQQRRRASSCRSPRRRQKKNDCGDVRLDGRKFGILEQTRK